MIPIRAELRGWADGAGVATATPSAAADGTDVVVNATPGSAAVDAVRGAGGDDLAGVVLLDVSNPLDFSGGTATVFTGVGESVGEALQRTLPRLRVVKSCAR